MGLNIRSNQVPFGLKDGQLFYVSQVETGLACGCVCPDPACAKPLVARNDPFPGRKRAPYFCHATSTPGCGGRESALHQMGKKVLAGANRLLLPSWAAMNGELSFPATQAALAPDTATEVFVRDGQMRPDLDVMAFVGRTTLQPLYVEIKVTHAVDHAKRERVLARRMNMIEIDLSDLDDDDLLDEETFTKRVLDEAGNRHWIHLADPAFLAKMLDRLVIEVRSSALNEKRVEWRNKNGHWIFQTQTMVRHSPNAPTEQFEGEVESRSNANGDRVDHLGTPIPYVPGLYVTTPTPRGNGHFDEGWFKTTLRPIVQDIPANAQLSLV